MRKSISVAPIVLAVLGLACGNDPGTDPIGTGGTNTGGTPSSGGTTQGSGGTPSTNGGTISSGGSTSGGSVSTGGSSSGGSSTGGVSTGGSSTGGVSRGGASSGGSSNGGVLGTGGSGGKGMGNGGSSSGGASSGGKSNTSGGSSSGGVSSGGKSNGGSGGTSSGGVSSGGKAGSGGGSAGSGGKATGGTPPEKTLRVFWLRPTDVPFSQAYPDGIAKVILEAQKYYLQELGKTFKVNDPIVETINGDHPASWYSNTVNGGDSYWYTVNNMEQEVQRKMGTRGKDPRWIVVSYVSATGNGGGSPGNVSLTSHDADGAAGKRSEPMSRWYGGMVHEMGHMFGLPDSPGDDTTPMSADFYSYPDTHFSQAYKNQILNNTYNQGFLF
jgi:hypothetical protein